MAIPARAAYLPTMGLGRAWMRGGVVLLAALLLGGADCPHCEGQAGHGASTGFAGATAAAPACHAAPESGPADPSRAAAPSLECGCPSCTSDVGVAPLARAVLPVRAGISLGHTWPAGEAQALPAPARWKPPPYPGFDEQTVVLLS